MAETNVRYVYRYKKDNWGGNAQQDIPRTWEEETHSPSHHDSWNTRPGEIKHGGWRGYLRDPENRRRLKEKSQRFGARAKSTGKRFYSEGHRTYRAYQAERQRHLEIDTLIERKKLELEELRAKRRALQSQHRTDRM